MRKRTQGRELALKYLFSRDLQEQLDLEGFAEMAADQVKSTDARDFARQLVEGILALHEPLKERIEKAARNWAWRRMPLIDRNLLLIGVYELTEMPDVPATVTINEVVELAKRFSTSTSGAFVNGVLDAINKEISSSECTKE